LRLNKFDKRGALDALRDVKKQYKRNHQLWDVDDEEIPVFGTIASQFNDPGMNRLYKAVMDKLVEKTGAPLVSNIAITKEMSEKIYIIPPNRTRYLSEITENNRNYDKWVRKQSDIAQKLYSLTQTASSLTNSDKAFESMESFWEQLIPAASNDVKDAMKVIKRSLISYYLN
jgi:methylmalonyl-CoA mutase